MPIPLDPTPPGLSAVRNFVSVLREISFDDVREQAETLPRILIMAPTAAEARDLGDALVGAGHEYVLTLRELNAPPTDLDRFDAIVVRDPARTGVGRMLRDRQLAAAGSSIVILHDVSDPLAASQLEALRTSIIKENPDRAPAIGRALPSFRAAAAKAIINETAMANGQFALLSNIPALIPIIGGIAAAGADFIVLTKNQVMMMYKLGAIYGRDLSDQFAIIQELVPVVGAGFVWRTIARSATAFIPFAGGTVPKVAISFVGTMVIGFAADHYYRTEMRPSKSQVQEFRKQATDVLRRLPVPFFRDGKRSELDRNAIEVDGEVVGELPAPNNLRYFAADQPDQAAERKTNS